jgi:ferredoxin
MSALKEAQARLAAYVSTLSPEKQARANLLRQRLGKDSRLACEILLQEAQKISEQQHRITERLERLRSSLL